MTLGANIKNIRMRKKFTLKEVSEKANVTKSLISQIENDKANPSVNTLKAIAKSLNVPIAAFFNDIDNNDSPVVKYKDRKVLQTENGYSIFLLTPDIENRKLEFLYNVFEKGACTGELYSHEGEECGIVLEGRLEITIEDEVYILEAGDSICIESTRPHRMANVYDGQTIAIWVNSQVSY